MGLYWDSIGIMEKKMETLGPFKGIYRDYIGVRLGLYRDNGRENGNHYNGLYSLKLKATRFRPSGLGFRVCCLGFRVWGLGFGVFWV